MTTDTRYNGWANYETWCVNLWLDNEQSTQEYIDEMAREILEEEDFNRDDAIYELAQRIEEMHDESMPEVSGVYADLLGSAMRVVSWYEIAKHYIDDIEMYAAGWNTPGCLPDNDLTCFLDPKDAFDYLIDEIVDSNPAHPEWEHELKADANGEFGATLGGFHYFITKV